MMEITAEDMQYLVSDMAIENTNLKGEIIALKRIVKELQTELEKAEVVLDEESTEE